MKNFDPEETCPKCGEECNRDSYHNGIARIFGPWGCPGCRWSEHKEFDLSDSQSSEREGGFVDQYGGFYPNGSRINLVLPEDGGQL